MAIILATTLVAQVFYYHKPAISPSVMIIPITFMVNSLLTTMIIYVGLKFKEFKITFNEVFKAVITGAVAFALQYLFELIYLFLASKSGNNFHLLNFSSLSLFHLYHPNDMPFYLMYPLQTINVWEILNVIIIIRSLKLIVTPNNPPSLTYTVNLTYFIGLFIWVLIVIYLNLSLFNK
ncbi:hypothetical protein [Pedobacter boryungensis]|uniref:hypothetical protein n=1 Tax=Pedobacter boryungensis TaxID=869962 RepID=UPI001C2093CE|nr:hypothetical protein [Pedobacter boryungensis]